MVQCITQVAYSLNSPMIHCCFTVMLFELRESDFLEVHVGKL